MATNTPRNTPRNDNAPRNAGPEPTERRSNPRKERVPGRSWVPEWWHDRRFQLTLGLGLVLFSVFLASAFLSFLFTGKADQTLVEHPFDPSWREAGREIENWMGLTGAWLAYVFIFRAVGLGAFYLPPLLFLVGAHKLFRKEIYPLPRYINLAVFTSIWLSTLTGYMVYVTETESSLSWLCGGLGYEWMLILEDLMGVGIVFLLVVSAIGFYVYFFNTTSAPEWMKRWFLPKPIKTIPTEPSGYRTTLPPTGGDDEEEETEAQARRRSVEEAIDELMEDQENFVVHYVGQDAPPLPEVPVALPPLAEEETLPVRPVVEPEFSSPLTSKVIKSPDAPDFVIETALPQELDADEAEEVAIYEPAPDQLEVENYDPTLDLSSYRYPTVELLNEYDPATSPRINEEEITANKDRIVETLGNYGIEIASIKATVGPTVTLYEIIPSAGIRISKIKSLEDDIALSLAALGIRIIAPIPGKGTIGIEVPNKAREMVSMRSVLATEKFLKSTAELPVVLGKTISNEVFVTDLAKMPHLLMAGATGQGKSVGLNVILTSLIYKKHPAQLKFVLVDPKKVELSIYSKIERHFLAMLPDSAEAIITDTKKVIYTLNSLCIEMDTRYDLLKEAGCRNIKEYNQKFIERRLNPEKGHRYMPYIVLVIDELADLMMTAGKEVETPIARLAQLARAIGIHLVIATQRPSVNVITGIIKANFPARLSFRVTAKIDSRTILDTGGADQLVGQGDMLLSLGSELTRLQCAFLDTPEVERVVEFVGDQRGYPSAYMLPEYVGEDGGNDLDFDPSELDPMFAEAARVIVQSQQGSTSLIQRKLKLGYNRAGRIIDQLEAYGIVGPFEGSKAREVLVLDEWQLEEKLKEIFNN